MALFLSFVGFFHLKESVADNINKAFHGLIWLAVILDVLFFYMIFRMFFFR